MVCWINARLVVDDSKYKCAVKTVLELTIVCNCKFPQPSLVVQGCVYKKMHFLCVCETQTCSAAVCWRRRLTAMLGRSQNRPAHQSQSSDEHRLLQRAIKQRLREHVLLMGASVTNVLYNYITLSAWALTNSQQGFFALTGISKSRRAFKCGLHPNVWNFVWQQMAACIHFWAWRQLKAGRTDYI